MKGSPLIVTMTKTGLTFVSNEESKSSFYVRKGHNISLEATPVEKTGQIYDKYKLVIRSKNELPLPHQQWFQVLGTIVMMISIFIALLKSPIIPVFDQKEQIEALKIQLDDETEKNAKLVKQLNLT